MVFLLLELRKKIISLIYSTVLVRSTEPKIRPVYFDKEGSLTVDSAQGLFERDGQTIAVYSIKPARVHIRPTTHNINKIILYQSTGRGGLCIFYYRNDPEHVLLASRDDIIRIERDDISAIRKAFRRFTRTARPDLTRKPGIPFKEYDEPK